MLKVSVIVPVYNTKDYLRKCLDSLVFQTIDEIEIIVVDDGSTDGSDNIVREYEEKYKDKIKAVYKENGGQASARNIGIAISTGEYIGFLDSDDYVDTSMFLELYQCAKTNNADYVGCAYSDVEYNKQGELVIVEDYIANPVRSNHREMFFNANVSPFISFYKGDMLHQSGVRFTEGVVYEDTAFWAKMIPFITTMNCVEKSLAYRLRRENSTTTAYKAHKVEQIFTVIDDIINFYKQQNIYDEYENELEYFCVRILLCSSVHRICCIKERTERSTLIKRTFSEINRNFPEYKTNPFFKGGLKNFYIRNATPLLIKSMRPFFMKVRQL